MNPPTTQASASNAEARQRKEERLIALYMDLTGASESTARSVYMYLGWPPSSSDSGAPGK
jgi:hypothetical protein